MVLVHRWGQDLPEDDIVAPNDSYKGVMLAVKQEGRHFYNPLFWGHEIHKIIKVPPGQCLVLTRKFGKRIPDERLAQGDVLALPGQQELDGERGILRDVLMPGDYRLNPYAYKWETVDAVQIKADQVGVRTLKVGKDPRTLAVDPARPRYVVPDGYQGVQQTPVPSGTYYVNPYVETITPVEVRSHTASLSDIEFPSRDGFILKPFVTVEYQVLREKMPEVLVRLTDEGQLHQLDATGGESKAAKRDPAKGDFAAYARLRTHRREQLRRPRFHPRRQSRRQRAADQSREQLQKAAWRRCSRAAGTWASRFVRFCWAK